MLVEIGLLIVWILVEYYSTPRIRAINDGQLALATMHLEERLEVPSIPQEPYITTGYMISHVPDME